MMSTPKLWTRRAFSQASALAAASSCLGIKAFGENILRGRGFVYVACNPATGMGSIHVFRVRPQGWTHIETLAAVAPSHMERHPRLPVLYALHATELWQDLPRGAVSAWAIDISSGKLTCLHTQPLALSAVGPMHACITPDGKQLIVAATGGGALNVLPLDEDGRPGPPHILRKEVGRSGDASMAPARPHQVVMHPDGQTLFSADAGKETLGSFRVGSESLESLESLQPHAGAAVSQLALSPCGQWMFAPHVENGSIGVFRVNAGKTLELKSRAIASRRDGPVVLAIHPAGEFLLAASSADAGEVTVSRIDRRQGTLRTVSSLPHGDAFRQVAFSPDGHVLAALESRTGRLITSPFDPTTGRLGASSVVAQLDTPICLLQMSEVGAATNGRKLV